MPQGEIGDRKQLSGGALDREVRKQIKRPPQVDKEAGRCERTHWKEDDPCRDLCNMEDRPQTHSGAAHAFITELPVPTPLLRPVVAPIRSIGPDAAPAGH